MKLAWLLSTQSYLNIIIVINKRITLATVAKIGTGFIPICFSLLATLTYTDIRLPFHLKGFEIGLCDERTEKQTHDYTHKDNHARRCVKMNKKEYIFRSLSFSRVILPKVILILFLLKKNQ